MLTHSINAQPQIRSTTVRPQPKAAAPEATPKDSFTGIETGTTQPTLREAFDKIHNAGGVSKTRLLDDNAEAWNARWRVLESAKKSINTQYFCWDKDIFGKAMLGHIFKKASQENVKTRIMVDATGDTFGTRGFKAHIGGRDYLQEVTALPNAEAKVYHPHYKKVQSLQEYLP